MKAVYLFFSIFFWVIHHDYVSSRLLTKPAADILGRMTEEFKQRETTRERNNEISFLTREDPAGFPLKKLVNEGKFIREKAGTIELPKLKEFKASAAKDSMMADTHFYIPRELDGVFKKFIDYKLEYGSASEAEYYEQFKKNVGGFKASLISKRARVFTNKEDLTLLREEHSSVLSYLPWEKIGTEEWEKANKETRLAMFTKWMREKEYHKTAHAKKWKMLEKVKATDLENFSLENYMSYDEMELAALMIVAGPTKFYSNCQVYYMDRKYKKEDHVEDGYIVGAIGPRLDKPGFMDWKQMVGAGSRPNTLRANIYGSRFLTLPAAKDTGAYLQMPWFDFFKGALKELDESHTKKSWFAYFGSEVKTVKDKQIKVPVVPVHRELFKQRLKITYGAYLDFVHQTMQEEKNKAKKAYVMVLPLGGGAWSINGGVQRKQMWPVIEDLIAERRYSSTIDTIHFVGFTSADGVPTGRRADGITISLATRFKAMDLTAKNIMNFLKKTDDEGKEKGKETYIKRTKHPKTPVDWQRTVRFTMYPWDSNALPGNEFFMPAASNWPAYTEQGFQQPSLITLLQMSGDPAAACCSDIIHLHNWLVNKQLYDDPSSIKQFPYHKGDVVCTSELGGEIYQAKVDRNSGSGNLGRLWLLYTKLLPGLETVGPVHLRRTSQIVPCPKQPGRRVLMSVNVEEDADSGGSSAVSATVLLSFIVAIAVLLISSVYMVFIYVPN